MASSGPLYPSNGINDATVGTQAWSNPSNISADDGNTATVSVFNFESQYLKGSEFGFAIPAGATINGILLEIKVSGTGGAVQASVQLVKGGAIGGTDKSTGAALPASSSYVSFGGASDLWGLSFTPADINALAFGAVFAVTSAGLGTASVDAFRITVYYTPGTTVYTDPPVGALVGPVSLRQTLFEQWAGNDMPRGTIAGSGTISESFTGPGIGAPTGRIAEGGSIVESVTVAASPSGTVTMSGTLVGALSTAPPPLPYLISAERQLRNEFALRLLIGGEDCTFLLDSGCTFSNTDPGGFEAASFSIPKDMPNTLRGQNVRLDCGLGVAWEGRVSEVQRSLGSKTQIQCEGYAAALKDSAASMVFVDRDLTHWIAPTYQRQIELNAVSFQLQGSAVVAADQNTPALTSSVNGPWMKNFVPVCETWYDAGPENLIERIYYDMQFPSTDSNWFNGLFIASDQAAFTYVSTGNLTPVSGDAIGYFNSPSEYRYAIIQFGYGASGQYQTDGQWYSYMKSLAVYGPHGLPGRGGDPVGFYPSDIAGWAIGQATGLQPGVIVPTDASGYIVDHYVQYAPVMIDQMVGDMATIQGWHWGVWPALSPLTASSTPRCDFRPRPAPGAFTAFCQRQDCETLDVREDLSQQYNRAVVNFSNVDGTAGCAIVTVDNPILDEAGIGQRTVVFSGGTMTQATAAVFGLEALVITNVQARVSGSADIYTSIRGPGGGRMPAWLLKAGIDRLRIGDLPSTDAWGSQSDLPISRVECSLGTSGLNTSVELGSGANLVETLQARLAAATVLAAQGGS